MVATVETSPSGMVHVHILYWGPWVDKADLEKYWEARTGAYVSDVRLVDVENGLEGAVRECTKYVIKGIDVEPHIAVETLRLLKGQRRVRTYGCFYRLAPEIPHHSLEDCPMCGERVTLYPGDKLLPWEVQRYVVEKQPFPLHLPSKIFH